MRIRVFTEKGCSPALVDVWITFAEEKHIEIKDSGLFINGVQVCVPRRSGHYEITEF